MRLKFAKKFIKLIKITNCACVAVYATVVMLLWCSLSVYQTVIRTTIKLKLTNFTNKLTN